MADTSAKNGLTLANNGLKCLGTTLVGREWIKLWLKMGQKNDPE